METVAVTFPAAGLIGAPFCTALTPLLAHNVSITPAAVKPQSLRQFESYMPQPPQAAVLSPEECGKEV